MLFVIGMIVGLFSAAIAGCFIIRHVQKTYEKTIAELKNENKIEKTEN